MEYEKEKAILSDLVTAKAKSSQHSKIKNISK